MDDIFLTTVHVTDSSVRTKNAQVFDVYWKKLTVGGMQPVSIMGKHLNNFERLSILEDYLSGSDSKVAIEQKYGLSHGLIRSWLSKFGLEDKVHPVPMKVSQSPQSELPLNEKEELEQLRKENRVLKSRLKREELGHQAYKLLVELAEETYGIQIRKNSEAK